MALIIKSLGVFFVLMLCACSWFEGNPSDKQTQDHNATHSQSTQDTLESSIEDIEIEDTENASMAGGEEQESIEIAPMPKLRTHFNKPTVAIVIDDITFASQLKRLQKLKIKVTPSIMPNGILNAHSNELRKRVPFYIVHFPLEAENFHDEHRVLKVTDSTETIIERVKQIKEEFPEMKFTNNHTGSKFSADHTAMVTLLQALREEGIVFVDSKTTHKSVAESVYQEWGERLLQRDVFLDYYKNLKSIKKQLRATIALAKKRGYAFAIGHPYPETMEALSDPSLLESGVEFVYLYELFE